MTSRERVRAALNHKTPDRTPVDLGSTPVSGISASTYAKLRTALGLPKAPVKVDEPYQMLGQVEPEVRRMLGIDTVPIAPRGTFFGFPNENWKPWKMFDGTDVLVPEKFNVTSDAKGDIYIYPQGDMSVPPSGHMPKDGFYFDAIIRQQPIDEDKLDPDEWMEDFKGPISDEDLAHLQKEADNLYADTDLSVMLWSGEGGIGDIALVPGPWMKNPKGIRDIALWYSAPLLYPDYVKGIFERWTALAIENLKLMKQAVGDKVDVLGLGGTDFGMQAGPFISPNAYREFFKPYHKRMNDWIHQNTSWKIMYHTCGSIVAFMDDFVDAGVDIVQPVQCSAAGMDPLTLKDSWGDRMVFWGAVIDTQKVLPFGTPDQVRAQIAERINIMGKNGGLVAGAIHNVQQNVPVQNLIAMFDTIKNSGTVR